MTVRQAHRQGRRVLAGVGGVHLMGRDPRRASARQTHALRAAGRQAAGQGVSGDGDDQPATHEDSPQPVEVLMTGQVGGLQRCTDLRTHRSIVAGKGRRRGEKAL